MHDIESLRITLVELGFQKVAELLDPILERAAKNQPTYSAFLAEALDIERHARRQRSEETRFKLSKLPHHKTLKEYDFLFQPSIDKRQIDELETMAFAARHENVILLGPPGVGKTHLAVGLAVQALRSGFSAYYVSLPKLISDLKKAAEQKHLDRRWRVYSRPNILIIDEVGYMQLDREAAQLFFQLICERYESGSIILTSNKYFSDWGELMHDSVIATAILDRLLHHSNVINIRGNSYRLKDRLKAGTLTAPPAVVPANESPA